MIERGRKTIEELYGGGADDIEVVRGLLVAWLDARMRLLSSLSCNEGEWTATDSQNLIAGAKLLGNLMKIINHDKTHLWYWLTIEAKRLGHAIEVNWDKSMEDDIVQRANLASQDTSNRRMTALPPQKPDWLK